MQKRMWLSSLILVFGLTFSIAQSAKEVNEILPGSWKIQYAYSDDEGQMDFPDEYVFTMTFESNGTAEVQMDSEIVKMLWEYNEEEGILYTIEDGIKDGFYLKKFKQNSFEMDMVGEGGGVLGLVREEKF